jgi:uncharacterized integral membrane protein
MAAAHAEIAEVEQAYRRARWTLIGHMVFLLACSLGAMVIRRFFKMPAAVIGTAIIVALLLFGGDVMRFFRCRDRLRRLHAAE